MQDLVLLVADKNMQFALNGALSRPQALGIEEVSVEFLVHPGRDGGVRTGAADLLALERGRFQYALAIFDLEGSGAPPGSTAEMLEGELNATLANVWGDHARAIVVAPEVDIWIWGADNAMREVLQWQLGGSIRDWLTARGFQFDPSGKPVRPKEALPR